MDCIRCKQEALTDENGLCDFCASLTPGKKVSGILHALFLALVLALPALTGRAQAFEQIVSIDAEVCRPDPDPFPVSVDISGASDWMEAYVTLTISF